MFAILTVGLAYGDDECASDAPAPTAVDPDPTCVAELPPVVPVVEWSWTANPLRPGYHQVMSAPAVANLTDDDGDGDVDADDVPDIVFTSFSGSIYSLAGAVNAISGDSGAMHWSVVLAGGKRPHGTGGVAVGDLDADGTPEVLVASTTGLLCLKADGTLKWHATVQTSFVGMPAIADLEGDGTAEVVYGRTVVNHDGTVRWVGTAGRGSVFLASFATDLDGDGLQEVVAGNTVYEADGTVRWNDGGFDGMPAVADLDGDGVPEIAQAFSKAVRLSRADGTALWSFTWAPEGGAGPPTLADFDGDGVPEIGVAGEQHYRVFAADGTVRWATPIAELTSGRTSAAAFDFEGDGLADVLFADEDALLVLDGATGAVEWAWTGHSSGTLDEYPVVADVDRDGSAEIVVGSNDYAFAGAHGITVFGEASGAWTASARPVWNQHAFHRSNVEDDGSIPAAPANDWTSFRAAELGPVPDLTLPDWRVGAPQVCTDDCVDDLVCDPSDDPAGKVTICHTPPGNPANPLTLQVGAAAVAAHVALHGDTLGACADCVEPDPESVVAWFPVENEGTSDGGPVDVVVALADGTEVLRTSLVVPVGEAVWVGPVTLTPSSDLPVTASATGPGDCDPADDAYVWTDDPCR